MSAKRRLKRQQQLARRKLERRALRDQEAAIELAMETMSDRLKKVIERAGKIVPFAHILAKALVSVKLGRKAA